MAVDFEKFVDGILLKVLEQATFKGINSASAAARSLYDAARANFSKHLQESHNKYSVVRTLINRDEPISTLSIYTRTNFVCGNQLIDDRKLVDLILNGHRCCITGNGGCGKSMFVKYLLLSLIENSKGKIPIFCELRQINGFEKKDIQSFIHYSINKSDSSVSPEHFSSMLKEGSFVIILDGFDEIDADHRPLLEKQIIEMSDKFQKNSFIVSSRPDPRFASWSDYRTWHVQPMDIDQVVTLIGKLKYDKDVKNKFTANIKSTLFDKHHSFLSNPLLATMMLLTYDQFANIPDKIHLFYEQAFETLFFKHDSSKQAGYQRRLYTGLPINDFKNCFALMCMNTYAREKFIFSEAEILDYLSHAIKAEGLSVDPSKMLKDLIESVCIMQREGLHISFTHRSFQEYFSAHFISRGISTKTPKLLDIIVKRPEDNAIYMAHDMNSAYLEREWILPRLKSIREDIDKINTETEAGKYLKYAFGSIEVSYVLHLKGFRFLVSTRSDNYNFIILISQIYFNKEALRNAPLSGEIDANASLVEEFRRRKKFPAKSLPRRQKSRGNSIVNETRDLIIDFDETSYLADSQLAIYAQWHKHHLLSSYFTVAENVTKKEALLDSML